VGQGAALLDVLVALLQSMVVLLLASGVYVALVVRKSDDSSRSTHPKAPAPPSGHQTPRADSPGL
jgi:flagellar basal body-associated protein FliL